MTEAGTHIVRVTLQGEPTIYREIEVESRKTLSDLAEAIVHAFGFEFDPPSASTQSSRART